MYKIVYFLPVMISMTVVAVLFSAIYEPNLGLINSALRGLGVPDFAQVWLGDPSIALPAIMLVWTWQYTGLAMLYLLAAMEGIPQDLHDAATVDGVSEIQRVRYLILPLISRDPRHGRAPATRLLVEGLRHRVGDDTRRAGVFDRGVGDPHVPSRLHRREVRILRRDRSHDVGRHRSRGPALSAPFPGAVL